ncbi:hypothetical protein ACMT1E_02870 [Sphingomonas flavalba]|uniref:hypothetical protein n=1 Tax=Sphingomonas flavalba TaxID=2559804 RepID=UPI0039DFE8CC
MLQDEGRYAPTNPFDADPPIAYAVVAAGLDPGGRPGGVRQRRSVRESGAVAMSGITVAGGRG